MLKMSTMNCEIKFKTLIKGLMCLMIFFQSLVAKSQTNTFPSTGNVGIGTTSPGYLLDVQGGAVNIQAGANYYYRAGSYLTLGNSNFNNRPYLSFNAVLTSSSSTNSFTPAYNAGSGLILWGDAG